MSDQIGGRILVVDDDPDIRMLLEFKLVSAGHEVVTAADGRTALRLVEEVTPDLVLLDVNMPGLTGIEVLRELRPRLPYLPVVLVTAKAQADDVTLGLEAGATAYVTKPFSPAEVAETVRCLLAGEPDRVG